MPPPRPEAIPLTADDPVDPAEGVLAPSAERSSRVALALFLALILAAVIIAVSDWRDVRRVLEEANWAWLPAAGLFVLLSYLTQGFAFQFIGRMFRLPAPQANLHIAGILSGTVNNLISSGGFAGYGVRIFYLRRWGVAGHDVMAASVFLGYLNHIMLTALFPVGLAYLLITNELGKPALVALSLEAGTLLIVLAGLSAFWWAPGFRRRGLRLLDRASRLLLRRSVAEALLGFNQSVEEARAVVLRRPREIIPVAIIVALDWVTTIAVLWLCLAALGNQVSLGVAVTGFAVGVGFSTLSMVPTGVGIQDLTLTGALAVLGVSIEEAVLANVLYRAVYNFVPFSLGLVGLWRSGALRVPQQV